MNKLLKAVQKGIKQSFILDDEVEDEEFVKSKVNTGININVFQNKFNDFCKNWEFDKALELYNQLPVLKPFKLEIINLLTIKNLLEHKHFFKFLDFSEFIVLINSKNQIIKMHEVDSLDDIYFIKINDDKILSLQNNCYISPNKLKFEKGHMRLCNDIYENDGYKICNIIQKNAKTIREKIPAIDYCLEQIIDIDGHAYNGFLPNYADLKLLMQYSTIINALFKNFGYQEPFDSTQMFWTCNENSYASCAWAIKTDMSEYSMDKTDDLNVLPLFKPIN